MYKNFNFIFQLFFKTKFRFRFPKKNNVVIYDAHSVPFAKIIFKKFGLLHTRFEEINITILIICIFKNNFKNLSFNYRETYLRFVDPKIIFTSIDTNFGFYLLGQKLRNYTFISVQNGLRLKNYYDELNIIKSKLGKKIKTDYIFVLGENDKKRLNKFFDARLIVTGNIFNNDIQVKNKKKKKIIVYIQQASLPVKQDPKNVAEIQQKYILDQEIHLIKMIYNYCDKNKFKFIIFIKRPWTKNIIENLTNLRGLNFECFSNNKRKGYNILDNSYIVITPFSSLGYESLARGNRTIFFPPKIALDLNKEWFPAVSFKHNKEKLRKFFLFGKLSENEFNNYLTSVNSLSFKSWNKISLSISKKVMYYSAKNKKINKVVKQLLN